MNLTCYRFILRVLVASPGVLLVYSPFVIGLTLLSVAIPFATGHLIDDLAYHNTPYRAFAVLAALLLLKALLTPILQRFICIRSRTIETDLQFQVLDAIIKFPPSSLTIAADGELVAKMTRDTYAVGGFIRGLYPRFLQAVVMMLASGCALFPRSTSLAVAFMTIFPLAIFLFLPFTKRFSECSHRVRCQGDVSFNMLFDFLQSLLFLRVLDAERRFADAPHTALTKLKECNQANDVISVRFGFLLSALLVVGEIIVVGVSGAFAVKGVIPVGDVVLYQMLFISAMQSVQGIISLLPEFSALCEGVDSLNEILRCAVPKCIQGPLAPLEKLTFSHVTFAYPRSLDHPVVKDFSATLNTGLIVGISGANGTGKSTLLKLAVGVLEPLQGKVLFNGRPFSAINLSLFRQRIGIVSQDNLLVTGTVRDNITLRDSGFSQQDIEKALAQSGFDSVIKRLPEGLDTIVGNRVHALSGGERQRLAIARAIIRNPEILVFDEVSNHLDEGSRRFVKDIIMQLRSPGRLVLLVGHDIELDNLCDVKIRCPISTEV